MTNTLPHSEIKKRMLRLNNLEKMYANQVKTNKKLKKENKILKAENIKLRAENKELRGRVEKLELIVEELQAMIFKKKNKKKDQPKIAKNRKSEPRKERLKESYRRARPEENEVTNEEIFNVK